MHTVITDELLLWSELVFLWSFFSYAVASDPLPEDLSSANFRWSAWRKILAARALALAFLAYLASHSIVVSAWLVAISALHPWTRLRSPRKWTAELEIAAVLSNLLFLFAFVKRFHLQSHFSVLSLLDPAKVAAVLIVLATLPFIVRGGTYIVRGYLRKSGSLPHLPSAPASGPDSRAEETQGPKRHSKSPHPSPSSSEADSLDLIEISRGRLIGNLERLILVLVVAAGSYAALAFLVAAKGLIRSEDLRDRDFAEYFLVGSLSSALVALCAGMTIRFALAALWPELLSLHMQ